jgi:hypothetical protein
MKSGVLILGFLDADGIASRVAEAKQLRMNPICVAVDGTSATNFTKAKNEKIAECQKFVMNLRERGEISHCLIQEINLGQAIAIPTAVSWFFEIVDSGIILEDDCKLVPSESVSYYLNDLDEYFRHDGSVVVCLSNLWPKKITNKAAGGVPFQYYETSFFNSWGWATSADLWNKFSANQDYRFSRIFHILKNTKLLLPTRLLLAYEWRRHIRTSKRRNKKTWALDFTLFLIDNGINIKVTGVNLVQHYPRIFANHVTRDPSWLKNINSEPPLGIKVNRQSGVMPTNKFLEKYTSQVVHGATLSRLFKGIIVRILMVLGFKKADVATFQ